MAPFRVLVGACCILPAVAGATEECSEELAECLLTHGDHKEEVIECERAYVQCLKTAVFVQKWGPEGHNVLIESDPASNSPNVGGAFDSLFGIIGKITGAWSSIVSAFGSSYSEQLVDKEFNNGWSHFKASSKTFQGAGLAYEMSEEFFGDVKGMIGLPDKYADDFQEQIKWIKFFDNITWSNHNTQFNIGVGGSDSQFTMFARNRPEDQKIDVLFMTVQQTFEKADNYLVISESRSILGGLWSSTHLKIEKIPAGLTDADLTFVADYFQLLAWQQIALASGMEVPPDPSFPSALLVV